MFLMILGIFLAFHPCMLILGEDFGEKSQVGRVRCVFLKRTLWVAEIVYPLRSEINPSPPLVQFVLLFFSGMSHLETRLPGPPTRT